MRILAAVDGSPSGLAAARFGATVASRSLASTMTVVTAGDLFSRKFLPLPADGRLPGRVASRERSAPEKALEDGRREAEILGVPVRLAYLGTLRRGVVGVTIAEAIAGAAERDRSDLVVVGSGGAKEWARLVLGSVTHRLTHLCGPPVAVARAGARSRPGKKGPFRILAATDGSKPAREAVRFAARLTGEVPGARLVVLTVSTLSADIALTGSAFVHALGVLPELGRAERRAAERILRAAEADTRGLGSRVRFLYRCPRRPIPAARAIIQEADRQKTDVLVLGNQGRSGFNDFVLGSVAQRILDQSRRTVILVRTCPRRRR